MILWDLPVWFVWGGLLLFGMVVGSFLNVCIYRLPLHESIWQAWSGLGSPPSTCPFCRQRIRAYDNVPLLGWLWLRGRCRSCRHWISVRYPFVEVLNGVLWVLLYAALVPTKWGSTVTESALWSPLWPMAQVSWSPYQQSVWLHVEYAYYLVLVEALLVASFIDFDLQIIPDSVTAPAAIVGFLGGVTGVLMLVPVWFQFGWGAGAVPVWTTQWPVLHGLAASLAGAAVGGGVVWYFRIAGQWVFRREAMGFGDVTLMAMIGSFLGWQPVLLVFFLAPACALTVVVTRWLIGQLLPTGAKWEREIPFGPYLSLAALIVILGWKPLFRVFQPFFAMGTLLFVFAAVMAVMVLISLWMAQGVKWLLGWPLYESEWIEEWTSADQLTFHANKSEHVGVGPWRREPWPGHRAGRGLIHGDRWRNG